MFVGREARAKARHFSVSLAMLSTCLVSLPAMAAATGDGINIAIIDTGIDLDHPEFTGRIEDGVCFGTIAACAGLSADGDDNNGHGTHVAGIAAAALDGFGMTGVAYDADLIPVKVLSGSGSGSYLSVSSGVQYAALNGAHVLNLSLGGGRPSGSDATAMINAFSLAADTSVIVAAAGNNGARSPSYPAAFATHADIVGSMLIVGSVNSRNTISSFSNQPGNGGCVSASGQTTCFRHVFVVAPGEAILSTYPDDGYARLSGTSMATPYVSGVAALVWSAAPYLTPQQVVSVILASTIDLGRRGVDTVYGRGLVSPSRALAPLGRSSIATSGGRPNESMGTQDLGATTLSGVFASAIDHVSFASDVVMFDAFGRDFHVDLKRLPRASIQSRIPQAFQDRVSFERIAGGNEMFGISALKEIETDLRNDFYPDDVRERLALREVLVETAFGEGQSLLVGHDASARDHFGFAAQRGAFGHSMFSASVTQSPFMGFAENASFAIASFDVGDELSFQAGFAASEARELESHSLEFAPEQKPQDAHLRSGRGSSLSFSWQATPRVVAGLTVTHSDEDNSLLGSYEGGAFALTDQATTTSIGTGVVFHLSDRWVAGASWSRGISQVNPLAHGLITQITEVEAEAYGAAIARRSIFGDVDLLSLTISRPLHIVDGHAVFRASTGVKENREIIYTQESVDLANGAPIDFELAYSAQLADEVSVSLNGLYQVDSPRIGIEDEFAAYASLTAKW